MNISEILILKFPNADFTKDIILQDDGNGPYIKEWNLAGVAVPTTDVLNSYEQEVSSAYTAQQATTKFNAINEAILAQLDDIDTKSIRALRTNDTARLTDLENQATALRNQLIRN